MPSIINSDDGVVSGTSGLKTTGGNDGLLNIQTNGSTAMSVNASQQVTFNNGANLPNTFGFKNRIINGGMVIDQRNAGASVTQTTSLLYTVDRFAISGSVTSKFTAQQSATAATGFSNSLLCTSSSAYTVGASEDFTVRHYIEGFNSADLGWGTANASAVTLSFWVRSSLTGTFGGSIANSAQDRFYVFSYTINAANTWEQKTITISGDTTGTWVTNNGIGIRIFWSLGAGATVSSTAGSWGTTLYRSVTGAVSVVGTNGATWYVTGVQLERGSTATSFDFRPYTTEFQLCQRYYEKGGMSRRSGNRASGTLETTPLFYKVMKRANPTLTLSGGYTVDGWGTYAVGAHDNPAGSNDQVYFGNMECTATSTVSAGGVMACTWTSSAEL